MEHQPHPGPSRPVWWPAPVNAQDDPNARRLTNAKTLARLLRKAGTAAVDAKARIVQRFALPPAEWRSIARSVWG